MTIEAPGAGDVNTDGGWGVNRQAARAKARGKAKERAREKETRPRAVRARPASAPLPVTPQVTYSYCC